MDFGKFDQRGKAERGQAFAILHPETGEPSPGASFSVRGSSSRTVQEADRQRHVAAMMAKDPEPRPATMGTVHEETVEAAIPFIVGFEGGEFDGRAATADGARRLLDLTLPRRGADADGKLLVADETFAMQVLERAKELEKLLGNV